MAWESQRSGHCRTWPTTTHNANRPRPTARSQSSRGQCGVPTTIGRVTKKGKRPGQNEVGRLDKAISTKHAAPEKHAKGLNHITSRTHVPSELAASTLATHAERRPSPTTPLGHPAYAPHSLAAASHKLIHTFVSGGLARPSGDIDTQEGGQPNNYKNYAGSRRMRWNTCFGRIPAPKVCKRIARRKGDLPRVGCNGCFASPKSLTEGSHFSLKRRPTPARIMQQASQE